jgi:2-oxoisovalerate ferredoxin oxidoreductase alpha subunit
MAKELIKGNEAVVKAAVLAGCRSFYGYPITPASEITEAAAYYFPRTGGTFLQAESEVAAINMVYGAAATGERTMTASSGPGISLMQEGLSYLAGAELPCVIVDITRGGPGLGNIAPEQSDYHQVVKGGGHGSYHTIVLAPHSVQEMCDLTTVAFELADRYRTPVVVMTDGFIGQMMEPVEFPPAATVPPPAPWAVQGDRATRRNLVSSIHLAPEDLERHIIHLEEKYAAAARSAVMCEWYRTGGAELIVVGHGIVARILKTVVDRAREMGIAVGLIRPITLWPFPSRELAEEAEFAKSFLVVELSNGQMVDDVRLAVDGRRPVRFYGRMGGMVPTTDELLAQIIRANEADHVRHDGPEAAVALWAV